MNALHKWVMGTGIVVALGASAMPIRAQGTSHAEDWLPLTKEEMGADLKALIRDQEALIAGDRKNVTAYERLARLQLARRTVEGRQRAIWAMEKAIRLQPKNANLHVMYARVLRAMWHHSESRDAIAEALKLDSANVDALYWTGRLEAVAALVHWDKQAAWNETNAGGLHVGDPVPGDPKKKVMAILKPITDRPPDAVITTERRFAEQHAARAKDCLRRAIALKPDFRPIYDWLGLVYLETGHPDSLAQVMADCLRHYPDDKDAHLFLALSYQRSKNFEAASAEYQKALGLMGEEEAGVMQSQDPLYVKAERKAVAQATEAQRADYQQTFWTSRDPLFLTPYNEREMEHYGRVAYANLRFSLPEGGAPGWKTDMGRAYIRFGRWLSATSVGPSWSWAEGMMPGMTSNEAWGILPPDRIRDTRPTDMTVVPDNVPKYGYKPIALSDSGKLVEPAKQVWNYGDFGLTFWNYDGTQKWRLAPESEMLSKSQRDRYDDPYQDLRYDLPVQIVGFRPKDRDKVTIEIAYALPKEQLTLRQEKDVYRTDLDRGVFLFDEGWKPLIRQVDRPKAFRETWRDSLKRRYLLPTSVSFEVPPGPYHVRIEVRDRTQGSLGTYRLGVDLKGFSDGLDMSGILLASEVKPTKEDPQVREDFYVVPNPLLEYARSELVAVYFEVYGLSRDPNGQTRHLTEVSVGRVKGGGGKKYSGAGEPVITKRYEGRGTSATEPRYLKIDVGRLEAGAYRLTLKVTDLVNDQSVTKEKVFHVAEGGAGDMTGETGVDQQ